MPDLPANSSSPLPFIGEQQTVINEAVGTRQFVEAGPGTGKTAVACARIAKLLAEGVNPSSILMISFTRTAVRELRDRIRRLSGNNSLGALNIYTIDQTAFRFARSSEDSPAALTTEYEVTIENAVALLKSGEGDLAAYVASLRHVLVDEAQDIADIRTDFVTLLIAALSPSAGATILADPCQAIFGFTQDQDEYGSADPRLFLQSFPFAKLKFIERHLTVLHRTANRQLLHLFAGARKKILTTSGESALRGVVDEVTLGTSLGEDIAKFALQTGNLMVFRKRVQAIQAANYFQGLHRLRIPGYPPPVFPWVALCFSGSQLANVNRAAFVALWAKNVPHELADGWVPGEAFDVLVSVARSGDNVDMRKLRLILSGSRPPIDLCYPDYGATGPIFSTIHASKGREADRVVLMLPRKLDDVVEYAAKRGESAVTEEARVYYVGATRVRKEFAHGTANTLFGARKLAAGKDREVIVAPSHGKTSKFQFGRSGDIAEDRAISVREHWCGDDELAQQTQRNLIQLWLDSLRANTPASVVGTLTKLKVGTDDEYAYEFLANDKRIAWSGRGLNNDLWKLAELVGQRLGGKRRPPKTIPHMKLLGIRTVAVSDDAARAELCWPYCDSGFYLAPMLTGFAHIYCQ